MATYNVDPAGGQTYTTVQAALNAAGAAYAGGDFTPEIVCWPGTYTEGTLNLITAGGGWLCAALIRAQDPNNRPVFTSTTAGQGVSCNSSPKINYGSRIPEFRDIIWSGWPNTSALISAGSSSGPMRLLRCDFSAIKTSSTVIRNPAGGTSTLYLWEIDSCLFDATGAVLTTTTAGFGAIRNCRIIWSTATTMVDAYLSGWLAQNNSVYSTAATGDIFSIGTPTNNAVEVASGTPGRIFKAVGTYDYNCVFGWAGVNVGTDGGHNITGNPGFISPATGDFSFISSSPCFNAGTTIAAVPTDYRGVSRPQSIAYDIGAFELISTAEVTGVTVLSDTSIRLDLDTSVASDATWADTANYTITPSGGAAAVTVITATASGDPGTYITLATSEHTDGGVYTVAWAGLTNITDGSDGYVGTGTAPAISSATLTAAKTLRVVWSEAMTNNAALTTAANYVVAPSVVVSSVARINATTVDLTLAERLPATSGTITANGPQDLALNPAINAAAAFSSTYLTFVSGAVTGAGRTITVAFNIPPISGASTPSDWGVAPVGPGATVQVTDVALVGATATLTVWPPASAGSTLSITCPTAASAGGVIG